MMWIFLFIIVKLVMILVTTQTYLFHIIFPESINFISVCKKKFFMFVSLTRIF